MPKISGYQCDGPRCDTVSEESTPSAWIKVCIPASVPVMDQGSGRNDRREAEAFFHNDRCLSRWAKARYDAAVERGELTRPGRGGDQRTNKEDDADD